MDRLAASAGGRGRGSVRADGRAPDHQEWRYGWVVRLSRMRQHRRGAGPGAGPAGPVWVLSAPAGGPVPAESPGRALETTSVRAAEVGPLGLVGHRDRRRR